MDDRLVQIFATSDTVAGEMLRGRLEAEGDVPSGRWGGRGTVPWGPSYLWVAAEHEVAARDVVEAVQSGAYALDDDVDVDDVPEDGRRADATLDALPRPLASARYLFRSRVRSTL